MLVRRFLNIYIKSECEIPCETLFTAIAVNIYNKTVCGYLFNHGRVCQIFI